MAQIRLIDCGAVIAAVLDIVAGTTLEPLAPVLAWEAVNGLRPLEGIAASPAQRKPAGATLHGSPCGRPAQPLRPLVLFAARRTIMTNCTPASVDRFGDLKQ